MLLILFVAQQKPSRGGIWHPCMMQFYSGPLMHFLSGVDTVEGDKPAIGNSSTVCVAGKVGEDGVGSAKRSLGIDDPFDLAQCGEEGLEGCRLGEGGLVGEELQSPGLVGGVQPFEEQTTEEPGEDRNGEEKAEPAGDPALAIGRDAASRDDRSEERRVGKECRARG